jgi:hypothetical protein
LIVQKVFVVPKLHDEDLLFLVLLAKIVDFSAATVEKVPALSDLVLESRPFVLEPNGHFSDLPIDHALALAVHESPEVLQFFELAFLCSLVSALPLVDLGHEVTTALLLCLVLLLEGEVDVREFVLEHLVFVVEGLANLVEFFVLFPVLVDLLLLGKAFFGELSDLDFVVGCVEELSFALLEFDPQDLYLLGESFDLDGLEDDDELDVVSEVCLFVVGKVLDARPE